MAGARPQSVASIHTTAPNTPTCEELQSKLEVSNRSIQNIKVRKDRKEKCIFSHQKLNDMILYI